MDLEKMKSYLKIDGAESDTDITDLITAAVSYINQKTGKTKVTVINADTELPESLDISTDELYNLCTKIMVVHWFENRGIEIAGTLTKITHSADMMIDLIAQSGDYT